MIPRPRYESKIEKMFRIHPAAALLGPRQCGKTTLARRIAEKRMTTYFDLENPVDSRRLTAPMTTLEGLSGLVIIDGIQRKPELFELLRVLADRPDNPAQFLILGSASPNLVKGVSESLAGRIGFVDLSGFHLDEIEDEPNTWLWNRGDFPRSYLAASDSDSLAWRENFVSRTSWFFSAGGPDLGGRENFYSAKSRR